MAATVSLTFPATESEVRQAVMSLFARLQRYGLPGDHAATIEIAVVEAVNNIVKHAYANTQNGMVEINCAYSDHSVTVHLIDSGVPFPKEEPPPGTPANVNVATQDLPEGGFGWLLIRSLTDKLSYERRGGENHLKLQFETLPEGID